MSTISVALTAIMLLALVAFMAPNIIALNRGKMLRNIAIWLAIFAGLGFVYQATHAGGSSIKIPGLGASSHQEEAPPPSGDQSSNAKGFTPPGE